ncbi:amidohydrolase family protein [Sediminicoccus sp. KRV36]|uniref:amidohydrolase family protein n=1 Tax=Sediminicoccus sp. KRV36 TaxID=3133721 RepID=UPI00200BD44F|nr:amidohydrolase family protein [Sediminicoccus rosea]UPY38749.1 amidohydrolase family protein [Sediminicoccus rosea]
MMLDSHIHLWRAQDGYDVWIRRKIAGLDHDFTLDALREAGAAAGMAGAVLVHATEEATETPCLLRLAQDESLIQAVIGWADPTDPAMPHRLDDFMRQSEKFRGLRVMPAFGDTEAMLSPTALANWHELAARGLTLDVLLAPAQLSVVMRLQDKVPGLRMMLNHCGRPLTATGEVEPWATALRAVARESDVCCKLSSLAERAGMDWSLARLQPYLDVVMDAFPPERLAFGSNWPVVNLASSYAGWWGALQAMLAPHAPLPEARAALFGGTAARFYGLPAAAQNASRSSQPI